MLTRPLVNSVVATALSEVENSLLTVDFPAF
jgi:hypothetical protein